MKGLMKPLRYVTRLRKLAFVSPAFVEAIAEGEVSPGTSLQMLMDGRVALHLGWHDQEEPSAIRPTQGLHSASVAMMPFWPFIGLGILYEKMALKIRYHVRSSSIGTKRDGGPETGPALTRPN